MTDARCRWMRRGGGSRHVRERPGEQGDGVMCVLTRLCVCTVLVGLVDV
ncbi:hypothetical protein GMOD_00009979 [Pyrenophora seminiperda CCB06]|uniref:Uncharacterized protein n=1 Tax=Pyrenophora seminiperda CCB06 TaxID=1302712 RepID=A0A3M7M1U5_9PLEO|nr:hypothetical protein GMOD_00009979 [Pyrenophora seminiperda CCB06]